MKAKRLTLVLAFSVLVLSSAAHFWPQTDLYNQYVPGTPVADYRFGGLVKVPAFVQQPYFLAAKEGCPIKDEPVCGVDGKTYQNGCFLGKANVPKAYDGWCIGGRDKSGRDKLAPENSDPLDQNERSGFMRIGVPSRNSCPCNSNYYPVCSDKGITYANLCRARCFGANVVSLGPCYNWYYVPQDNVICGCSIDQSPVCSTSGVTYENTCVMTCAGEQFQQLNPCTQKCNCQFVYKPVCGVDGRNYLNECELSCAGAKKAFDGKCETQRFQKCLYCFGEIDQVCGKDAKTYDNLCYMKCSNVDLDYKGVCKPPLADGPCVCPKIYLPVCSSEGITYNSECDARCAGKKVAYNGGCKEHRDMDIQVQMPTIDICIKGCAAEGSRPTCGSDGRTYGNHCALGCHQNIGVRIDYDKPCRPFVNARCPCNSDFQPVCGVDGKTYLNICTIQCVGINKAWDGPCDVVGNYGFIMAQYYKGKTKAGKFDFEKSDKDRSDKSSRSDKPKPRKIDFSEKALDDIFFGHMKNGKRKDQSSRKNKKDSSASSKKAKKVKKGFMFKMPLISTVPDDSDRFENRKGKRADCPSLNKVIDTLYPRAEVKDPKKFMGFVCKKESTRKSVSENPISFFVPKISEKKAQSEISKGKFDNKEKVISRKDGGETKLFLNDSFTMVSDSLKAKIAENPYMYYTYFYSLLHYGKVDADTLVEDGCKIQDIMIYICVEFFNIQPKFEDHANDNSDWNDRKKRQNNFDEHSK